VIEVFETHRHKVILPSEIGVRRRNRKPPSRKSLRLSVPPEAAGRLYAFKPGYIEVAQPRATLLRASFKAGRQQSRYSSSSSTSSATASRPPRHRSRSRHADLSVRRQCTLLGLARAGIYRQPAVPDAEELALMRWIDEQYLATPFYGSRRMTAELRLRGRQVNRKRVQRLMRLMGLEALGPKPKTSRPAVQHRVYPYLLRGLTIDRPNQVWAADITYLPMARSFLYLVVVVDWYSATSWRGVGRTQWTLHSASTRSRTL